ncbi:glycosyltransferase [Desulfovibrio sp. JC010]|uniref:glycosyltransferase family protein n=1 Tax=Desulfovibrio sp. JC010 TaxID=2593641 RepID=UPI0013D7E756|nr:glycosyltransferase [Desulfovibrio sp. JC010]NDV26958.1 glycosyltransferase family 1 protein [Desulfovibrio sp. JC010]
MKIVILESGLLASSFRELGHDVFHIRWDSEPIESEKLLQVNRPLFYQDLLTIFDKFSFQPDLVFWHDVGNIPRVWGLEALDCPTVGYFIDTYCNPWHVPYSYAFDCAMVAQKNAVPLFNEAGYPKLNKWFPLFYDKASAFNDSQVRDIPVCFVGTVDSKQNIARKVFLDTFAKFCPILVKKGAYQPLFARSKIILNQSAAAELNYRTFETAACGAAVLTEDCDNGLLDLFTPGENILPPYERGNAKHAAEIALEMLSDEQKLDEIARAGERLVNEKHSSLVRAQEVLDTVAGLSGSVQKRITHGDFIRSKLVLAAMFICGESKTALPPQMVSHFGEIAKTYQERWDKVALYS